MPRLKYTSVLVGGVLGGIAAAALLGTTGRVLGWDVFPWSHDARTYTGRAAEWAATVGVLAPIGAIAGMVITLACAIVFELVTRRGGWWRGAAVGLFAGVSGAAFAGLVPWLASYYGYTYLPRVTPFGPHAPSWALAAVTAAGILAGAIGGACYATPLHAPDEQPAVRFREVYRRAE
jgi:hypothetical protein